MKKFQKTLSAFLALLMIGCLFCGSFALAETVYTTIENNSANIVSPKWVGAADGSVVVSLDTNDVLTGGNALKAELDRTKNEWTMATLNYNYETNVTASDGITFYACAEKSMTLRVAVVVDWANQRYADITVDTAPRAYTLRWADMADYGTPFAVDFSGNFTQIVFQNGRVYEDPMQNTLYVDEVKYFVGDDTTDLSGKLLKSTFTTIENNSADTISPKWAGAGDGSVAVSLDKNDVLTGGNALKAELDRTKNEWTMATLNYNYETNVAASDGITFYACAEKSMTLRVAVVVDWANQRYADITVDTAPRAYTLRWADMADYGTPFAVDFSGNFTQIVFQNGRVYEDPMQNTLYVDELKYFVGNEITNLSGKLLKTVFNTIENNSADTISPKWAGAGDGSVVVSLDKNDVLTGGNALKAELDRTKNEWTMATLNYNYETNVAASDGVTFYACAEKPMTLRVAVVVDWANQRYADITVDTVPRAYTLRWADMADYGTPFAVDFSSNFTQIVFQNGRVYEDPMQNTLYVDELQYFIGDEETDLTGKALKNVYTLLEDNSADTISPKWAGAGDGSVVVSLDKNDVLTGGNALKAELDRTKNEWTMATLNYNYEANTTGSDGITFYACAEKPMTLRVAVAIDWKQMYADITVDTAPRAYTIRWTDMTAYEQPFNMNGKGYLSGITFQNGRVYEDPMQNTLYIDEINLFYGYAETDLSGTKLIVYGDLDGNKVVDSDDLTMMAKHVAKIITIDAGNQYTAADITGDGKVDSDDMTKLAKYVAKIISSLDPADEITA